MCNSSYCTTTSTKCAREVMCPSLLCFLATIKWRISIRNFVRIKTHRKDGCKGHWQVVNSKGCAKIHIALPGTFRNLTRSLKSFVLQECHPSLKVEELYCIPWNQQEKAFDFTLTKEDMYKRVAEVCRKEAGVRHLVYQILNSDWPNFRTITLCVFCSWHSISCISKIVWERYNSSQVCKGSNWVFYL